MLAPGSRLVALAAYGGLGAPGIGRGNTSEHCRCTHRIPGIVLRPPGYVCDLLGCGLHLRYGVLQSGFGISGLLGEKDPLILRV